VRDLRKLSLESAALIMTALYVPPVMWTELVEPVEESATGGEPAASS
jgi:hypothetical protein